jgi:ABC-2 type transport system ATP-binding protein
LQEWKRESQRFIKGKQQKIQFISTVLHERRLLILDEPFSGLDPIKRRNALEVDCRTQIERQNYNFSDALMETAEKLCDGHYFNE